MSWMLWGYFKMKKTITLAYVYSDKNAGDMAINLGAISLINELWENCNLNLISRYSDNSFEFYKTKDYLEKILKNKSWEFYPSPFVLDREASKIRQFKNYMISFFKYIGNEKYIKNIFEETDLFILNGGNLIRSENLNDFFRLIALSYPLKLSCRYSKDFIVFPSSTTKINKIGSFVFNKYFSKSKLFFTREEDSYTYLKNNFKKNKIFLNKIINSIDLAYFIDEKYLNFCNNQLPSFQNHIALTFRVFEVGDIKEFTQSKKKNMLNNILDTIDYILGLGEKVVLVSQTEKDIYFTKQVYKKYEKNRNVSFLLLKDPLELRKIYSEVDLLIGMRLHSIILATSVGTPSIGIFDSNWGKKNPGTMKKFGLPYIMNLEGKWHIHQHIEDILRNRHAYSKKIKDIIEYEKINIISQIKDLF